MFVAIMWPIQDYGSRLQLQMVNFNFSLFISLMADIRHGSYRIMYQFIIKIRTLWFQSYIL
jgi:hypothetical protein